jgi:hypothetical protein
MACLTEMSGVGRGRRLGAAADLELPPTCILPRTWICQRLGSVSDLDLSATWICQRLGFVSDLDSQLIRLSANRNAQQVNLQQSPQRSRRGPTQGRRRASTDTLPPVAPGYYRWGDWTCVPLSAAQRPGNQAALSPPKGFDALAIPCCRLTPASGSASHSPHHGPEIRKPGERPPAPRSNNGRAT